jgi:HAAS
MPKNLDAYLEEISHYLSGREEREEILSEIRSHILEKAEQEFGASSDESLDRVIAAYGPARRVAEKYLDGRPIIAPAFRRYLFRYTALLFAVHIVFTAAAVALKESFLMFPLLYVPSLSLFEAVFYLPMALLFDFGVITLILYLITQSQKDFRLPWPRFSVDLAEVKVPKRTIGRVLGLVIMTALTGGAAYLYVRFQTIFLIKLHPVEYKPIFTPEAGQWYSLIVISLWALGTIGLAFKLATSSPWVTAVEKALSLVLLGLVFRQPFATAFPTQLPEGLTRAVAPSLTIAVLIICLFVAIDLVKAVVRIGRRRLAKPEGRRT